MVSPALFRSSRVSNSGTTRIGRRTPAIFCSSITASTSEEVLAMEIT